MALVETEYTAAQTHSDYTGGDNLSTFGGDSDLWGAAAITPEQLADPAFKIAFDADIGAGILRVDEIAVEVFFELPQGAYDPSGLPPFAAAGLQAGEIGPGPNGRPRFIVVGTGGAIKTSDDGDVWTERQSGVADALRGIAAGESGFVAVGDNGTVLTSSDGEAWTQEESGTTDSLITVAFDSSGKNYIACGRSGVVRKKVDGAWLAVRN